jgi:hypothetical protein
MFKALLLQSWHALSDPALEKQLARDLLFHRFIGLNISESVADHSTLWRFRQLLEKQSLMNVLLNDQPAQPLSNVKVWSAPIAARPLWSVVLCLDELSNFMLQFSANLNAALVACRVSFMRGCFVVSTVE